MKSLATLASVLFCAPLLASPALASGACVYDGYNRGSPEVFKFVKWEFGKREGDWLKVHLTLHNNLKYAVKRFELTMRVDDSSIGLTIRQPLPANADGVIVAEYPMTNKDAARFQPLTPLVCVRSTQDEKGVTHSHD